MKGKKKPLILKKDTKKKPIKIKLPEDRQNTTNTTKQKTFPTIEENYDDRERKKPRFSGLYSHRYSCVQKMDINNISPFSSPGKGTMSPKCHNQLKKQNKNKQLKKKKVLQYEQTPLRVVKAVRKNVNENYHKQKFEQQFLALNNSQKSLSNDKKQIKALEHKKIQIKDMKENKVSKIKEMKSKIEQKYRQIYPNLQQSELHYLCIVTVIQRLWRQKKLKKFIKQFIYPKQSKQYVKSKKNTVQNKRISQLVVNTIEKQSSVQQNIPNQVYSIPDVSTLPETPQFINPILNIQGKQTQRIAVSQGVKEDTMMRFVECLRQVKLAPKQQKANVFNLRESLSEKCLMQKFYQKIFKDKNTAQNFEFFPSKSKERYRQSKIGLISPQKDQLINLNQIQVQIQCQEAQNILNKKCNPLEQPIKSISQLSQQIMMILVDDFSQQFYTFSTRKCLKKKVSRQRDNSNKLPGLNINKQKINAYISGLLSYILKYSLQSMLKSFNYLTPPKILKIYRIDSYNSIFYERQQSITSDQNWAIIENNVFFEYQNIYEQTHFHIQTHKQKYSNFLLGLIKIHNKSLMDCVSQLLEGFRTQLIYYPWDINATYKKQINHQLILQQFKKIQNQIQKYAFTKLGPLRNQDRDEGIHQSRLLQSIHQQYINQGKQWTLSDEKLEVRLQLSEEIYQILLQQFLNEYKVYIQNDGTSVKIQ